MQLIIDFSYFCINMCSGKTKVKAQLELKSFGSYHYRKGKIDFGFKKSSSVTYILFK